MKYENARDILPEQLLRQVQKYVSGMLVYIPSRENKREWGMVSGYRLHLQQRNRDIRAQFALGETVQDLADAYHLSCETIKRIVYNKKEAYLMNYRSTLSSAQEWARHGSLEDWVHAYLLSDGNNKPFSDGLRDIDRIFLGPMVMPLRLFHRCTGPEKEMRFRVHPVVWENHVQSLMEAIPRSPDIPPLIVHYLIPEGKTEGEFELNDGNNRFEAYTRLGIDKAWVIVWITDRDEYEQFIARYGEYVK
ncbi:MAG: hypothetical protein IJ438_06940 [Clostridia bacterium]|nr:hypothetical protein [Clostridia bacterium]